MKQFIALIIGLILVISAVPLVMAENDTSNATSSNWETRLRERSQLAIQKYEQAKERYQLMGNKYDLAKQRFLTIKKNSSFSSLNETPELMNETKEFLLSSIDKGVQNLETVKAWIEKINIPEEKKSEMLNSIENSIGNLNEMKSDVNDIETKREAVELAKKIRNEWQDARNNVKQAVGLVLVQRTEMVSNALDRLSTELQKKIYTMEEQGKNSSKVQDLLDDFDEKIAIANEKYSAAREKFYAINGPQDADQLFKEGRTLIQESQKELRDAQGILKQIVQEFRAQNVSISNDINSTTTAIGGETV